MGTTFEIKLDADFSSDERLFHYTSASGLYGILSSNCLWATHFKFLNDSNEFFAAEKFLSDFVYREILKKIVALRLNREIDINEAIDVKGLCRDEAKTIIDVFYRVTLKMAAPFIFSSFVSSPSIKNFDNGELLHWATYGRDGGYALKMNPYKLAALMGGELKKVGISTISKKAAYLDGDIPKELKADFEVIGKTSQEMVVNILDGCIEKTEGINAAGAAFMRLASIIKDDYFRNEGEARLVALRYKSPMNDKSPLEIFVRQQGATAIPYIKLFEGKLLEEGCPIESIIVGPHPDRERRTEALKIYLESRGLAALEVKQSEVPYLGG